MVVWLVLFLVAVAGILFAVASGQESVRAALVHQQRLRVHWWLSYVSAILPQPAKDMLRWLTIAQSQASTTTTELIDKAWAGQLPDAIDRRSTLDWLKLWGLTIETGNVIAVTDWGRWIVGFVDGSYRPLTDYPGDPEAPLQITT